MTLTRAVAAAIAFSFAACLSTNPPAPIRYYAVDPPPLAQASATVAPGASFRLRRVDSAAHLRERMVWRRSDVEYGFGEDRRWTELPIAYVERALVRELVHARGLVRSEAGGAPALDVELLHFDEVVAPEHVAHVELALRLVAVDGAVLLDRRIAHEAPVGSASAEAAARALSAALAGAVGEASDAIVAALAPER